MSVPNRPPIKHKYKLDAQPDRQYDIYCAAATVRSKVRSNDHRANNILNKLEEYVNGAIIQYNRIQEVYEQSQKASTSGRVELEKNLLSALDIVPKMWDERMWSANQALFLDIHYYLICLDKIDKLYTVFMPQVSKLHRDSTGTTKLRKKRRLTDNLFSQLGLSLIVDARNFLEHIDMEILEGNSIALGHDKNKDGEWYTCNEGRYKVSLNLTPLKKAYEALMDWLSSLPALN